MNAADGRRPALALVPPLRDEPNPKTLGAVELLPDRVRAALLAMDGTVIERAELPYPGATASAAEIGEVLLAAAQECFGEQLPIGIGVAAAGLVDPGTGTIIDVYDAPALHGFPVAAILTERFGPPVHLEHRARLQVLGDRWFGAGRGVSSFASVSTGEVLGVGILYEGQVLAPPGGRSGAHMTVAASGALCTCGARGCWKTLATTQWLRSRTAELGFDAGVGVRELAELAADGDDIAGSLVDEYAANLALGLVNVQQLFAPGLFVLHGEARDGGERFRERIERRLREDSSWAGSAEQPSVVVSEGAIDDIALLGGAGLVLSKL
jgi:glucokinase